MMQRSTRTREQGLTFTELAIAMLVMAIISTALVHHLVIHLRSTTTERDRQFAMNKANSILNEIQGFVEQSLPGQDGDLDSLDDGIVDKANLTILRDSGGNLMAPSSLASGNTMVRGQWEWTRRITVRPFAGADNRNLRFATVRISKRDPGGTLRVVANISSVVNAPTTAFATTQVFDLYLLAIENIPGWWVFMDSIQPFVESTITDLETRNPGLEVRTHWITKSSFGRNPIYRPFVNDANDSVAAHTNVYYYPGRMPTGNASSYYYVPANMRGHMSVDGVDRHGHDDELNPHPYSLADYWNHSMRYPDEVALWQARVADVAEREAEIAAAIAGGTTPPDALDDMSKEPTLRLFLEDLNTNPTKYTNALVINLHGELLPMPALRNFSDAAKDPVNLPNVRAVTHPEKLRTLRATSGVTENAKFRVYAYNTHEPTFVSGGGSPIMAVPVAVEVLDLDLTDGGGPALLSTVQLQNLAGGVDANVDGSNDAYTAFASAKVVGTPGLLAREMYYSASFVDPGVGERKFTRILLYNTPGVATEVSNRGLRNQERSQLYRMSYVPAPCEAARDFSVDLYNNTGGIPKNTARWRFEVPAAAFTAPLFRNATTGMPETVSSDVVLAVRTRLWTGSDPANSGTMWPASARNAPENLSTTYTWWCDSNEDVPITERAQFQGDPRHSPYRDLLRDHQSGDPGYPSTSYRPTMPDGYNWYFDNLNRSGEVATTDAPGLSTARLADRWRGRVNFDAPRLFELLRKGLVTSDCVYTTLTGWSYYYLGIGNDIGYDSANGYPNSIPVNLTPHGSTGSGFFNNITGSRTYVRAAGTATDYWWSIPWLGELCPDSAYASQWAATDVDGNLAGNLVAGNTSGSFYQQAINSVHTGTTRQGYGIEMLASHQNTSQEGCTSFFNIGTSTSTFHHQSTTANGSLTAIGTELAENYNFTMPAVAPISRPFGVATNGTGTTGTEWALGPYSTERFSGTLFRTYFTHPGGQTGSGLVKVVNPGNTDAAYVVVNGFDNTIASGSTFIAKFAVLSLVHSYFEAGSTTNTLRIKQPPRVEILAPTDISELLDPANVDIVLSTDWTRWDSVTYTQTGSYSEDEAELQYVLMYSTDRGATWRYVQDDTVAEAGVRPTDPAYLIDDQTAGDEVFTWELLDSEFPQGSYYLRAECYRQGASLHYSYHQTKLFVQR
ncbi:MAG: hypothetical protein ABL997_09985 [Planctomycetota bacterium]